MGGGPGGRYQFCLGLDVHKATVCIAVAEGTRGGEVRQLGVVENRPEILRKVVSRLSKGGRRLSLCPNLPTSRRHAAHPDPGLAFYRHMLPPHMSFTSPLGGHLEQRRLR